MNKKQKNIQNKSIFVVDKLLELLSLKNLVGLAKALDIPYTTLTSQIHRDSLDYDAIITLAAKKDIDLNYLFLGKMNFGNDLETKQIAEILLERLKIDFNSEIASNSMLYKELNVLKTEVTAGISDGKKLYSKMNELYELILTKEVIQEAKQIVNSKKEKKTI